MTVEELRRSLDSFPSDALVVIAKDSEGNGHSPLTNSWQGFYDAEQPWFGSVYDDRDIKECALDASKMVVAIILTPMC